MKRQLLLGAALPGLASLALLAAPQLAQQPGPGWKVVAWNDLGMHCMDSDYSVFSILPPFNNVRVQVVQPDGSLLTNPGGITVTYEGVFDPSGSRNTTSIGKTQYWTYTGQLYGGSSTPDTGLAGHDMPGPANVPQAMTFDPARDAFVADGVPITPFDDQLHGRTYPVMKFVARNGLGQELASTVQVLPISDEMDCRACHSSLSGPDAEPAAGWVNDPQPERDYRLNLLKLHDEQHLGEPLYQSALAQKGFSAAGLLDHATTTGPILCASCHRSNALPGTGVTGVTQLTEAIHAGHAGVIDPTNGMTLDSSLNRSACYRCHPGSETRCLRGAMGAAVAPDGELAMQCQSCHASMSAVGDGREGWLDQPNCQACHTGTATNNNGQIRYTDAYEPNGELRVAVNATFATQSNVPLPGYSLYRESVGHGGLSCEACHGSTHAVYPAAHPNDNLQNLALQDHVGTLAECSACHSGNPNTVTGGPHGMHPVGNGWVNDHHDAVEGTGTSQCRACHGIDYRGTVLSTVSKDRVLDADEFGNKAVFRGSQIGCYLCHNGPNSENPVNNTPPVVSNASMTVADVPVATTLFASDANGNPLTLRIVQQPSHGRVGLVGETATYHPDPGFAGTDTFTFAARDANADSNLGTVTVTRQANQGNYGTGFPGTGGVVPGFTSSGNPSQGASVLLAIDNSWGFDTVAFLVASTELASLPTMLGGMLWTEPATFSPISVPAAGLPLPTTIPVQPQFFGLSVYLQAIELDPGAAFLFSFTPGLRLTIGP